jgi:hypothetical protein
MTCFTLHRLIDTKEELNRKLRTTLKQSVINENEIEKTLKM